MSPRAKRSNNGGQARPPLVEAAIATLLPNTSWIERSAVYLDHA
jgi:hypothetical protein